MNKRLLIIAITAALTVSTAQGADSSSAGGDYYMLGGGASLPPPGSGRVTFNIRSRLQLGFGYSCGKFNFQNNITQMINQFRQRVRELPGQLQQAVSAAVAGLPGYLMQKYNPTLYNILTKTLDESYELFNMSYKTCEQMEAEMARDPNANPYDGFFRASIANKWTVGGNQNNAIAADVYTDVKRNPASPISWIGGQLYGTQFRPIQLNRDMVVAGYNIMLGRTADVSITSAPTGTLRNERLVQTWANPDLAGRWIQEVVGDKRVVLSGNNQTRETIPGKGLKPKIVELRTAISDALNLALNENDYSAIQNYPAITITPTMIGALRSMPDDKRNILRDNLVEEMAIAETIFRANLVVQLLVTGVQEPNVSASTAGALADEYVRNNTLPAFERRIDELLQELGVAGLETLDGTASKIIEYARNNNKRANGEL